jgi:hypothetical protein
MGQQAKDVMTPGAVTCGVHDTVADDERSALGAVSAASPNS